MSIRDWPERERPRERLLERGPKRALRGRAAGVLLGTGVRGHSALDVARGLLLGVRLAARPADRRARSACARRAAWDRPAMPRCRRRWSWPGGTTTSRCAAGSTLAQPAGDARIPAVRAARPALRGVLLPAPGQPPSAHRLRGAVPRHDRRRQRPSPGGGQAGPGPQRRAVILAHNHRPGVAEPSQADELITRRLRDALALVDIRVLDHLIVGDGVCESFAERGLL